MLTSLGYIKTKVIFAAVLLGIFLSGCEDVTRDGQESPTPETIDPQPTFFNPTASVEIIPDTGWIPLKTGLENRTISLVSEEGTLREFLYIVRLDPELFRFGVGYRPSDPLALQSWMDQSGAVLVINGGFFTEENEATGLVIADGESFGISYQEFGGMLAVDEVGPKLRWLGDEPYDPDEHLTGAVQSFPMLVLPDDQFVYAESGEDKARRSVIARDSQGRFIFLVAGVGFFTLNELSQFLIDSDLELEIALNLDGGASSGMLLTESQEGVPSFSLLPTVILVYEK